MATAQHLPKQAATDWVAVERLRRGRERLLAGGNGGAPGQRGGSGGGDGASGAAAGCSGAVGVTGEADEAASRLVGEPKASAQVAGQQWQVRSRCHTALVSQPTLYC